LYVYFASAYTTQLHGISDSGKLNAHLGQVQLPS